MNSDSEQPLEEAVNQKVKYVEQSIAELASVVRQGCTVARRLSASQLKTVIAAAELSIAHQDAWELAAGPGVLSPAYFASAAAVHEGIGALRAELARR